MYGHHNRESACMHATFSPSFLYFYHIMSQKKERNRKISTKNMAKEIMVGSRWSPFGRQRNPFTGKRKNGGQIDSFKTHCYWQTCPAMRLRVGPPAMHLQYSMIGPPSNEHTAAWSLSLLTSSLRFEFQLRNPCASFAFMWRLSSARCGANHNVLTRHDITYAYA